MRQEFLKELRSLKSLDLSKLPNFITTKALFESFKCNFNEEDAAKIAALVKVDVCEYGHSQYTAEGYNSDIENAYLFDDKESAETSQRYSIGKWKDATIIPVTVIECAEADCNNLIRFSPQQIIHLRIGD